MQMIIAPAKRMRTDTDNFDVTGWPEYLGSADQLLAQLRTLDTTALQQLWHTSDQLTQSSRSWLNQMDLRQQVTPAVMAFVGLQYQSLAADLLTDEALAYLRDHLRILSGLYGILRPFDGIVPYRLDMGSRLAVGTARNLYAFWGRRVYAALDWSAPVINLASMEYARVITPYLTGDDCFVDVVFGRLVDGHIKTRATYAKMARGALVRFAASHAVDDVAGLTDFDDPHYRFAPAQSSSQRLVFLRRD
ncbi:peroxide stress protein YaaA [Lacticaseibacillus thailandensis]|uniref:UPF0246 protein FD19_GL000216 n=1 Tax=Lacticaseibacillus thailandensis DSM 22698 = JCM 13996 TaxID=1423810 RepID=A0A0R2C827_9LACO|nr:peroxide stress protein YaaA [Lacticaseibacillus thailandensis]KRM87937.1 hypothetical protein FD19_GL000216 [Lacticaseibacillus thailandensis DSM 22698 = JCM 13996]